MKDTTRKRAIWTLIFIVGLTAGIVLSAIDPIHDSPQTASAPQPIAEIVVKPIGGGSQELFIYTASSDAYNWVSENAGEFGSLFAPEDLSGGHFSLFVDPTFSRAEVIEYIQTMGTGFISRPTEDI